MAIAIKYAVSADACAGGNHYQLQATITGLGADIVTALDVPRLDIVPTKEERKAALEVITWIVARKYLADATHAQIKALIDNRQIVLDPQVVP